MCPLIEVQRLRAMQAIDVVGAPADDPNRKFTLAGSQPVVLILPRVLCGRWGPMAEDVERWLAAVLAADVAGYSRRDQIEGRHDE